MLLKYNGKQGFCVMMLSKFYQILIHILTEMLLKYHGKQGYIHKVLKKVGVYSQEQNCLL